MYSIAAIPFFFAVAGFLLVPIRILTFNEKFYLITLTGAVFFYGLMLVVKQFEKMYTTSPLSRSYVSKRRTLAMFNILTVGTGGLSMFLSATSAFISIMTMPNEILTRIFLAVYVTGMLYCLVRSGKYLATIEYDIRNEYDYQNQTKTQQHKHPSALSSQDSPSTASSRITVAGDPITYPLQSSKTDVKTETSV